MRELENVIRQALLLARPFAISLEHMQQVIAKIRRPIAGSQQTHEADVADLLGRSQSGDLQNAYERMLADLEPELYRQAIQLAQNNQSKAARWLGVTRMKMREKPAQFGLHPAREDRSK